MSNDPRVIVEVEDGIVTIELHNPEKGNALTRDMYEQLRDAWPRIENDPEAKVVVFTGAGDRHLCTGGDLSTLTSQGSLPSSLRRAGEHFTLTWRQAGLTKPVIVAVNGTAAGGGLGFVTDGNIVLATRRAKFMDPHVNVGQICGYGALRLVSVIGASEAMRMALARGVIDAERAFSLGLVNELFDTADEVKARARALAEMIVAASPTALRVTLQLQRDLARTIEQEAVLEAANRAIDTHMAHPDAAEGPQAFLEGRAPNWRRPGVLQ